MHCSPNRTIPYSAICMNLMVYVPLSLSRSRFPPWISMEEDLYIVHSPLYIHHVKSLTQLLEKSRWALLNPLKNCRRSKPFYLETTENSGRPHFNVRPLVPHIFNLSLFTDIYNNL